MTDVLLDDNNVKNLGVFNVAQRSACSVAPAWVPVILTRNRWLADAGPDGARHDLIVVGWP